MVLHHGLFAGDITFGENITRKLGYILRNLVRYAGDFILVNDKIRAGGGIWLKRVNDLAAGKPTAAVNLKSPLPLQFLGILSPVA